MSSYEFILCAQILYLMITRNKQIKSIKIENKHMKLTQFADNTCYPEWDKIVLISCIKYT